MTRGNPCQLPGMLPNYDPNDNEAGMKILEDLTENVEQIQQRVLEEIITRNARTDYLKGFLDGQFDKQAFKKTVPVVNYEEIKPYIERIANGDSSNIISAEPIIELLTRYTYMSLLFYLFSSEESKLSYILILKFLVNAIYLFLYEAPALRVGSQR